jgi:hypothetical protein
VELCEQQGVREAQLLAPEPELTRVGRTSAASLARWDRPRHGAPDADSRWDDEPARARIAVCTYAADAVAAPGVAPGPDGSTAVRPDRIVVVVGEDGDARVVTAYNAAHAAEAQPESYGPPAEYVADQPR